MTASRYLGFILLAVIAPVRPCLSAAALDPELKKPYQLHIVLHFTDSPQFTAAYRARVGRDLGDAVQGALGDLGEVKVVSEHPRLQEVLQNGLPMVLESWKERSGVKTHFVLVRSGGLDFEIQTGQHDGITGQASPFTGQVVRRARTHDRDFVARTAALLVTRDFGLVGTVLGPDDGHGLVRVAIRGGGIGAPLEPWVKKEEVFGLVGLARDNQGETVFPWLVLRVDKTPEAAARDGVCVCRLYSRLGNPLRNPAYAGFRCVKLGTTRGPVRLRLVRPRGPAPAADPLTVTVRRFGFDDEEGTRLHEPAQADGTFDSSRCGAEGAFDHLAFVSIHGGAAVRVARLPVPILTDDFRDVSVPAAHEPDGLPRFQYEQWTRNVNDSYLVQRNLFKRLKELTAKPELRKEALDEARAGLERCRADNARLTTEQKELEQELQKAPEKSRPNLSAWADRIRKMSAQEAELVNFIGAIDAALREENDPERQKALTEKANAQLLEAKLEYGEAIAALERVRKVAKLDTPELRANIARLQAIWEPKGDKHRDARAFIYHIWPGLDTPGLKKVLPDVQQAFAECRRVNDRLGPQKLLEGLIVHGQRIKKELAPLNPRINVDDEPKVKLIEEVAGELSKLEAEVEAYLKATAPRP